MDGDGWHPQDLPTQAQRRRIADALRPYVPAPRLEIAVEEAVGIVQTARALEADGINAEPRGAGLADDAAEIVRLIEGARDEGDRADLEMALEEIRSEEAARRRGRRPDYAARALVELAAGLWLRETGRHPALGAGSRLSPWQRFAQVLIVLAGLDTRGTSLLRIAAEERWGEPR